MLRIYVTSLTFFRTENRLADENQLSPCLLFSLHLLLSTCHYHTGPMRLIYVVISGDFIILNFFVSPDLRDLELSL